MQATDLYMQNKNIALFKDRQDSIMTCPPPSSHHAFSKEQGSKIKNHVTQIIKNTIVIPFRVGDLGVREKSLLAKVEGLEVNHVSLPSRNREE